MATLTIPEARRAELAEALRRVLQKHDRERDAAREVAYTSAIAEELAPHAGSSAEAEARLDRQRAERRLAHDGVLVEAAIAAVIDALLSAVGAVVEQVPASRASGLPASTSAVTQLTPSTAGTQPAGVC